MNQGEIKRINNIANISKYSEGPSEMMVHYTYNKIFKNFLKKGSILELGPAEGVGTSYLSQWTNDLTIVEGSSLFCDILQKKYPSAQVICSLFEHFRPMKKYNNIILGHVLEHVEMPVEILSLVKTWLSDDGVIMVAVPNCNSIHRQAAVKMGILEKVDSFSELDIHHGHRRVYSYELLKAQIQESGLNILKSGGYWLKPVSNMQIEQSWSDEMLKAFMELGEQYPEIAAEIYIIATNHD